MKKHLIAMLVLILGFVLVACNGSETKIDNTYYTEARALTDQYYEDFWVEGANRFKAYHPEDTKPDSDYKGTAALWGYGAAMTMVSSGLTANPKDKVLIERAHELVRELEQYRYRSLEYRYYSAIVNGTGEPYYDDNAWVVLALYELAKTLDKDEYMQLSRDILDFVLSGESEDGGIYWKVNWSSRNVAAIGPAMVGALLHYQNNPEAELLETVKRLYEWTVTTLKDPRDHVYWDNAVYQEATGTEKIETTKWTYNSGTMIWSSLLLYEITGEEKYLNEATLTTKGSYDYFLTVDKQRGISYFPTSPWFNVYLTRAYREYANVTGETKYIEAFIDYADLALERGRDEKGYIYPSWGNGRVLADYKFVSGLEQAGSIEILYLIAGYQIHDLPVINETTN